jgi:flagellar basal-body rod modification protein FlgD
MQVYEMSAQEKLNTTIVANEANKKNKTGDPGTKNGLGKDSFLKLLVTELRHQDPTKPMEDKEFIAQMAQFSSLEQMSNISKEMRNLVSSSKSSEAYGMLGKDIEAYDPVKKTKIQGTVNSVFFKGDEIMLTVGREEVSMKNVHSVTLKEKINTVDIIKNLPVSENTKK